jgi:hypothetical protein
MNNLYKKKRSKANWIGHILGRTCLLKYVIEEKIGKGIEVTEGRGIRRKQVLDDLKETNEDWKLKEEALHRTVWRSRSGR